MNKLQNIQNRNQIAALCHELETLLSHVQNAAVRGDAVPEDLIEARQKVSSINALAMEPTDFGDEEIEIPLL